MMLEIAGAVTFDLNVSSIDSLPEEESSHNNATNLTDVIDEDIQERLVEDDSLMTEIDDIPENADNTWTIIDTGSQKGNKRLVDCFGYTFVVKRENIQRTNWRCSVWNKKTRCPATVKQIGTEVQPNSKPHNHTADPGKLKASQVRVKITASFIPVGYLKADVRNKDQRHIIFATDRQLLELSRARQWFIEGTFKTVKRPFYQLLPVHAFVRSRQVVKMMLLLFVVMSSRTKSHYVKVLNKLLYMLPEPQSAQSVVMDFEAATWGALRTVLPDVRLRGCLFHFTQVIWRKVQEIGLTVAYRQKNQAFWFIRKLMALPLIPASEIRLAFEELAETVRPSGWHRRVNCKVGEQQLGLYKLSKALHREASLLPIQILLVKESKLWTRIRDRSTHSQQQIFDL